ncbi:hypothetical protein [Francisella sciaenopsi]|uniref:Uncharacterized protein n=1 Tax=Francisella sciaenopsi TaxID=3055034 RepID=A0ABQ6PCX8_9GAMM
MNIKKLMIILGSTFLCISLLNAIFLEITKTSGNIPGNIVPGVPSSESSGSNTSSGGSSNSESLVSSLYDANADEDPFTFDQNIGGKVYTGTSANCTDFKCTVAEINGERWMVQQISNDDPAYNTIQLYKEDSEDSITLYPSYEGGTDIDSSRDDAEQLQQLVNDSITLFNEN